MSDVRITEDQMVGLVRNALLVAGQEMGQEGDHWPVIKSTIYSIAKDWEELKVRRAVRDEMRVQIYAQLDQIDQLLLTCSVEAQAHSTPKLKEIRSVYDAYFEDMDTENMSIADEDIPAHVKRAHAIIMTLED